MRGSGLFVFAPSGQVTIGAAVQEPPAPLRDLLPGEGAREHPPAHSWECLSPGLSLSPLASLPAGQPQPPKVGPSPARQPASPAPEPEVRAGDSATEGACAKPAAATPTPAEPGLEPVGGWTLRAPYFRNAAHRPLSPGRSSRRNCPGEWAQKEPSSPGACARVENGAVDSVVAWKGAGGRSDG